MSLGRPARPRLDHGARKGKGDDYQEVDVNGKRLSHKNTRHLDNLDLAISLKKTFWSGWVKKLNLEGLKLTNYSCNNDVFRLFLWYL